MQFYPALISQFKKKSKLANSLVFFILSALFSLMLASLRFDMSKIFIGFLYLVRFTLYTGLIFILPVLFTHQNIKHLLYALGITTVLVSIFQYIFLPDIRFLQILEWDPHYFRVVGSLLDPGFTGLILLFFIIFTVYNPLPNKLHFYLLLSVSYLTFALTYSRSSYLGFIIFSVFLSRQKKNTKIFLYSLLLILSTILILPRSPDGEGVKLERTSSILARIQNWKNSISVFSRYPIFGSGFNVYRYTQNQMGFATSSKWLTSHADAGADSSILFVTATTGIIGLFFYLNFIKLFLESGKIKAEIIVLIFHSIFLNSLFYPFALVWLALAYTSTKNS